MFYWLCSCYNKRIIEIVFVTNNCIGRNGWLYNGTLPSTQYTEGTVVAILLVKIGSRTGQRWWRTVIALSQIIAPCHAVQTAKLKIENCCKIFWNKYIYIGILRLIWLIFEFMFERLCFFLYKSGLIIDDNWSLTNNRKPTYINSEFPWNVTEPDLVIELLCRGWSLAGSSSPATPTSCLVFHLNTRYSNSSIVRHWWPSQMMDSSQI